MPDTPSDWCFIYLHNRRIGSFKSMMDAVSPFPSFVLQGKAGSREGAPRQLLLGGIVFIQGEAARISEFFRANKLPHRLVCDCSTHKPAVIPEAEMRPLRQVSAVASERMGFLPKPFSHYQAGHARLRVVAGPLQGLEGCVLRIKGDRKLVMGIGNLTIAIAQAHREHFEEVAPAATGDAPKPPVRRRLTFLQEAMDKSLFFPRSRQEVEAYAGNVDLLLAKALRMLDQGDEEVATDMMLFLLEEMAYHFSAHSPLDLAPIVRAARRVTQQIEALTHPTDTRLSAGEKERLSTECDALLLTNGHLFA